MSRPADQLPRSTDRRLIALVGRVADEDQSAFARLYRTLAPAIAQTLRPAVSDPTAVAAVVSATFVEVWWLARFHTAADTDVPAWIVGIAIRRARERPPVDERTGGGDHSAADRSSPARPVQLAQDRHDVLMLARLLDDRSPAGRPPPYRSRTAAGVGAP